jgi:hypothetical protein
MKRGVLTVAAVCGLVAGATFSGAGTASAAAAPPGYSGPFLGDCKGIPVRTLPLSDGKGTIEVSYDSAGSGTYCAKTFDHRDGSRNMHVYIRHEQWTTSWSDTGFYSTYAGGIYVSQTNTWCAYVYGWVEVNGRRYDHPQTLVCDWS